MFLFAGIFVSCKSETDKVIYPIDNNFIKDLTELNNQQINYFNSTRANQDSIDLEQAINDIAAQAVTLAEKYVLISDVKSSGYYREVPVANMDMYELIEYFESNATPEFYNLIMEFVESLDSNKIDNYAIMQNTNLLPTEKLTLISTNNIIAGLDNFIAQTPLTDEQKKQCRKDYDAYMKECKKYLAYGIVATLGSALLQCYFISASFAAAAALDYANCTDYALSTYLDCMGL